MNGKEHDMTMNPVRNSGFTLIELMVVVVIIAIFAAIAIPSYEVYIARAQQANAKSEMLRVAERLENYRGKQLSYAGYIPENQVSDTQKGIVNIPFDAVNNFDYQIILVDLNNSTLSLEESVVGQGWRMIAVPNKNKSNALRKSNSLLLDSRGTKCATADSVSHGSTYCTNAKEW